MVWSLTTKRMAVGLQVRMCSVHVVCTFHSHSKSELIRVPDSCSHGARKDVAILRVIELLLSSWLCCGCLPKNCSDVLMISGGFLTISRQ